MDGNCHRLINRVAIVTGGATGIGAAIARRLAMEGASVAIADIVRERGQALVAEIETLGGVASFFSCDVSHSDAVRDTVGSVVETWGGVDILVNNAGIPGTLVPIIDMEEDNWVRVLDVNLGGMFRFAKFALPHLIASGHGAMVNISSSFGMVGAHNAPAYSASKGGVIGLTKQLAVDYGPYGVRVNAVAPGYVDNDMDQRRTRMTTEDAAANLLARETAAALQPLGRQAQTAEVAAAVAFLVSDDSSFMTGTVVPVDGGCTAHFNLGRR